jgi:hypothetical protein
MVGIGSEEQPSFMIALHEFRNIGFDVDDVESIQLCNVVLELDRLRKMVSGVDKVHGDRRVDPAEDVDQNEAVRLEGRGRKKRFSLRFIGFYLTFYFFKFHGTCLLTKLI